MLQSSFAFVFGMAVSQIQNASVNADSVPDTDPNDDDLNKAVTFNFSIPVLYFAPHESTFLKPFSKVCYSDFIEMFPTQVALPRIERPPIS